MVGQDKGESPQAWLTHRGTGTRVLNVKCLIPVPNVVANALEVEPEKLYV